MKANRQRGKSVQICVKRAFIALTFLVLQVHSELATASPKRERWIASWTAAQQILGEDGSLSKSDFKDATLRQIVHLSIGGSMIRVRISNTFGVSPLRISSVHIARAISPSLAKIDVATDQGLTFAGETEITIPAGADYVSDSATFQAAPLSDLSITFHLALPSTGITGHSDSRATSYLLHGDRGRRLTCPTPKGWSTGSISPPLTSLRLRIPQPSRFLGIRLRTGIPLR